jgi:quercetin dioxygenase-like cupin family protein
MPIPMNGRIAIAASAAMLCLATPGTRAQATPANAELQWIPAPSILPLGATIAVVNGNPFTPGEFTIEFRMPDKYTLPPHTNPAREHVMVKSGALRVGLGRKIDRKKSLVLAAGDTATTRAGVPHWSIAEGEVEIVVTYQTGPFGIAYMSVRDEPGAHAFPSGY